MSNAEGSQVLDTGGNQVKLLELLQQQGVQPTPANLAAAMQGMLAQGQSEGAAPRASHAGLDAAAPSPAPQRATAAAPTVQASTMPSSQQQVDEAGVPPAASGGSGAPTASSAGMSDMIGAALAAAGLGGLGYMAMGRRGGAPAAAAAPTATPVASGAAALDNIVPNSGMPKSSLPTGPTSNVAPMSDVATQQTRSAPPVAQATVDGAKAITPQQLRDAATGSKLSSVDWKAAGIADPALAIPPVPGGTAVELGPQQELLNTMKQANVTMEQLPPEIRQMVTSAEKARIVANRPGIWKTVTDTILGLAKVVR